MNVCWRIEYTNHPFVEKKRRKILEKALAKAVGDIENLLKVGGDSGLMLGDTGFSVESTWLPDVKKHHIAVHDLKKADDWVASIVFNGRQTMTVEEVKNVLRSLGLNEYSIYGLGVTNEKTVGQLLAELEENLAKADREELAKKVDLINATFLEGFLEKAIIRLNDGMLDALRKIENAA